MTTTIEVIEQDPAWTAAIADIAGVCQRAADAAFAAAAPDIAGTVCIVLAGDADVRALNAHYRGKDAATDILSFAYQDMATAGEPEPPPLGDVILAFGVCSKDAALDGRPLRDHLSHLVVHGILHLLGYDHVAEDDAKRMEALETRILANLGLPDPYAAPPNLDNGNSTP